MPYQKTTLKNNYILICSDEDDSSTDIVCGYLYNLGKKFVRISAKDKITVNEVFILDNELDFTFVIQNKMYRFSEMTAYWYRRSKLTFAPIITSEFKINEIDISPITNKFQRQEYETLIEFIEDMINSKSKLNKFTDNFINKLSVLKKATEVGLNVPNSVITTTLKQIDRNKEYINKAIGDLVGDLDDVRYCVMTKLFNPKSSNYNEFSHTLFQENIYKKFELRIFFFNNTFYPSAIFSQSNPKTKIDFRNYDMEKPNRVVPFKLHIPIQDKLYELFKDLDMNSGSVDMIIDQKGEYYFLEINPVGQFEQVSIPCRYYLHKEIAIIL